MSNLKKFTQLPIGLGINHPEQEESIAHHWNECIVLGVDPSEPIEISDVREYNFTFKNYETGLSIENTNQAEKVGDKWRLTDKTIQKCKNFLNR